MTLPDRLSEREFIGMTATLFATIALSIDAMLPALPQIAAELTPEAPNRAQLIVTSFVLSMGVGTLIAGPVSDALGRRRVILAGGLLYALGALVAWASPTLEGVLAGRLIQGLGAAGPRVVSLALVRDLYSGRQMARVISLAMMIFTLVPAVAPAVGTVVIDWGGWRSIFAVFVGFAALSAGWFALRQAETLPPAARRPLRAGPLAAALRETLSHRVIVTAMAVQSLVFGMLFGVLSSTQPIFDRTFGRAEDFPGWFAVIALVSGSAGLLNAQLVTRLGMRRIITRALAGLAALSAAMAGAWAAGIGATGAGFAAYLVWTTAFFFGAGLTLGNLNALALEPVGHIAGLAASLVGAVATIAGLALAVPMGLAFDGTALPLAVATAVLSAAGSGLMRTLPPR